MVYEILFIKKPQATVSDFEYFLSPAYEDLPEYKISDEFKKSVENRLREAGLEFYRRLVGDSDEIELVFPTYIVLLGYDDIFIELYYGRENCYDRIDAEVRLIIEIFGEMGMTGYDQQMDTVTSVYYSLSEALKKVKMSMHDVFESHGFINPPVKRKKNSLGCYLFVSLIAHVILFLILKFIF